MPSGWAVFVGILLFIIGIFNVIWGLTALLDDEVLRRLAGQA